MLRIFRHYIPGLTAILLAGDLTLIGASFLVTMATGTWGGTAPGTRGGNRPDRQDPRRAGAYQRAAVLHRRVHRRRPGRLGLDPRGSCAPRQDDRSVAHRRRSQS